MCTHFKGGGTLRKYNFLYIRLNVYNYAWSLTDFVEKIKQNVIFICDMILDIKADARENVLHEIMNGYI